MTKRLFLDVETTGLNPAKHSIHQIAGIIEIDGIEVESFDIKLKPNPKAKIDDVALEISGVTLEQIRSYQSFEDGYKQFIQTISKHIDQYNKTDKFHLVGYNNRSFDDNFVRGLLKQNSNNFFGSYFWSDSIDVLVIASYHLEKRRPELPNFKLNTVAEFLGIEVEQNKLHDALYDIKLTKLILEKIKQ